MQKNCVALTFDPNVLTHINWASLRRATEYLVYDKQLISAFTTGRGVSTHVIKVKPTDTIPLEQQECLGQAWWSLENPLERLEKQPERS